MHIWYANIRNFLSLTEEEHCYANCDVFAWLFVDQYLIILNGCYNVHEVDVLRITQHRLIDHFIASSGENNSSPIQSGITPFYHLNLSHPWQPYPLLCDTGFYVPEVSLYFVARLLILKKDEGWFLQTHIVNRALLLNNCMIKAWQ